MPLDLKHLLIKLSQQANGTAPTPLGGGPPIARRALIAGGAMAAGDGLVRPLNAPPGQQTPIGVQPGASPGTFIGRLVLVFGPSGVVSGVFVYPASVTPGAGAALLGSITSGIVDPFGNPVIPGFGAYDGSFANQYAGQGIFSYSPTGPGGAWVATGTLIRMINNSINLLSGAKGVLVDSVLGTVVSGGATIDTLTTGPITFKNGASLYTVTFSAGNAHPIFPAEIELAQTATPSAPGSGVKVWSDTSGILRAVGTDTSVLAVGTQTDMFTGTMLVSVNGFTTLTDGTNTLSVAVGVNRKYKVRARVIYQATSGVVGTPTFTVASAAGNGGLTYDFDFNSNASGICRYDNASGFGTSEAGPAHATAGAATFVTLDITGTVSMTAGGTIAVQASIGGAGNSTFTVQKGSFLEVGPI